MLSNKNVVTLLLVILVMKTVASTTPNNTQEPNSSGKPALRIRRQGRASGARNKVLQDMDGTVNPVEVQNGSIGKMDTLLGQLVNQRRNGPGFFETLMNKRRYKRMCYFARRIGNDKFLKHIYPLVKTFEQYKGIVDYLKRHNLVASFYVYGDIGVVREAIAESGVYNRETYFVEGNFENALRLAFKEDQHDRIIELLNIRKEITVERDNGANFEYFMYFFLNNLVPKDDGMALKRFLTFRGDELRSKYSDMLDVICQRLVFHLRVLLYCSKAEKLLVGLIGQPSLLRPVPFTKGFLRHANEKILSNFVKYGWDEAIEEGLKKEYDDGGERLWQVMKEMHPDRFIGEYPLTTTALVAVLKYFPTKRQREDEWIKKIATIIYTKINSLESIFILIHKVLWFIIAEYAVSLIVMEDSTVSEE